MSKRINKPRCEFVRVAGPDAAGVFIYKCRTCHRKPIATTNPDPATIHANCLPPETFMQHVKRYAGELLKWFQAGAPQRSPEEIREIYETHCAPCEHLVKGKSGVGRCKLCGCSMKKAGFTVFNKIALATSHCPVKKW